MADKRTRWIIEATSNIPDINKQLEQLISLQRTQNELTQQNTTSTALAIQRQREQIEQLTAAQTKATTASSSGAKQQMDMMGALRKEYDLLSKTLSGIAQLAAGAWAVGQIKTFTQEVIKAKSANDGFVASMEQMLGSRLKAEELNAKLINIALKSPFNIDQLQEVTKKLQGMGVETEKLIPYINMLGDISAIVGSQKLPLIAKALTDVQSKHVLMAQEIKQFTDNGVPLYDLLAKSMQKPVEEIRKLATEHKITFVEVEKALMDATQKGGLYYGQMATQSKQLAGQVSNLSDLYTQAKARIGDYFENGIRNGIKATGQLIEETIGSENAITRLIATVKAALALWISYRSAVLSVEAAKKANNVTTLANLASLQASNVATVGMTASTFSLSAAMRGLTTAIMANPFGFLITSITTIISLMYGWEAVTTEVGDAQNLEAENLRKVNREMQTNIEAAIRASEGTKERRDRINDLIKKYPEYFAGMDAEKVQNWQLQKVLNDVNGTFEQRIKLATLAYQQNKLIEKDAELAMKQAEAVKKLREEYEKLSAANPSDEGFIKAIENQLGLFGKLGNLLPGMLTGGLVESNLTEAQFILSERKKLSDKLIAMETSAAKVRVDIEHEANRQKLKSLSDQLAKGEISLNEYNQAILSGTNEVVEKQVKAVQDGEDKKKKAKKSSLELSLENDLAELKSMQKTYEVKMQIINTEEKLKIEQAKRTIKDKEDQEARILSIEKESANKRGALALEFATKELASLKKWLDDQVDAHQKKDGKINALREVEKFNIEKFNKEVASLQDKVADQEARNYEKQLENNVYYRAEIMKNEKSFWKDREELYLEGMIAEQEKNLEIWRNEKAQLEEKAKALEGSVLKQKEYQKVLLDIAVLSGKISEEERKRFESEEALMEKKIAKGREYFSMALEFANQIGQADTEAYAKAWDEAVIAVDKFYDYAIEANKKAFEFQVKNTNLSLAEMNTLWNNYADRQKAILQSKQDFDYAAQSMKNVIENMKAVDENMNKFTQLLSEGKWLGAVVNAVTNIFTTKKRLAENEQELNRLRMQQELDAYDYEITLLNQWVDQQNRAIQDVYDKKVEAINKEMEAEEAKAAKLQKLAEQYYSDSQLRLQKDDVYRAELLASGEAREVKALQDARDRQVKAAEERGATAEEVARIVNAFEQLITDKHKEYQEAQGNVTKETSLANQEVKAQEADAVADIQDNLQSVLDNLRVALYNAQVQMQEAMVVVAHNAAQAQIRIEEQKFEVMRQMAIAELEIAGKKALGKGDAKGHIAVVEQIEEIKRMPNPFTGMAGPMQIYAPGIPGSSIPPRGSGSGRPRNNNSPGDPVNGGGDNSGEGPNRPGRPRFHGDTWVTRDKWDPESSYGIDEIFARIHEGERVVPSYLNQFLGPKVTNEPLVHGYLQASMLDRLPDVSIPQIPQMVLPDFSASNQTTISMERVEKKLDELNQTFANKSLIQVNIDGNAVSISEHWAQHKATYYDTLLNR